MAARAHCVGLFVLLLLVSTEVPAIPALNSIESSQPTVQVGQPATLTITGIGESWYCGIEVRYSDGSDPTLVNLDPHDVKLPLTFNKTFTKAGKVDIAAEGKRIFTSFPCPGSARTTIQVVDQVAPQPAPQTAPAAVQQSEVSMAELRVRAKRGDLEAMYSLANILANAGENSEAFKLFLSAAKRNHAKAMNSLGFMYEEGRGTLQDHKEAAEWYRKAMMRGNPDAMVNRGLLLAKGLGVGANLLQAYVHFNLAAAYADEPTLREEAAKLRDEVAKQLSSTQITAAQSDAKKLAAQIRR